MMKKGIIVFFAATLALFYFLHGSHKDRESVSQEKHIVEVRLVLVDVVVKKDERFVTDLKKEDFELYEDGKKIPINSFELIISGKAKTEALEEERKDAITLPNKQLVVIFDGINTWNTDIKKGAQEIVDDLVSFVEEDNEIMVLQLGGKQGLEILQPFTSDEELVRKAIEKASGTGWKAREEFGKSADFIQELADAAREDVDIVTLERALAYMEQTMLTEYLFTEKQKFEVAIGGLLAALNKMKGIPGKKSVLLISDGLPDLSSANPDYIMRQTRRRRRPGSIFDALRMRNQRLENERIFDPLNILEKEDFMTGEEIIEEVTHFSNTHNISIYSLDPGQLSRYLSADISTVYKTMADPPFSEYWREEKITRVQNLESLSKETGAIALRGGKRYEGLRQVLDEDLTYYYELSFYPRREEADGKYHKIKVKVKRSGVDVSFRKGYQDYSKQEANRMLLLSAFYNPSIYKQLPFEAKLIPFYAESGKCESWMNIAIPVKEFFIDRFVEFSKKTYCLHFWMKERSSDKMYGGKHDIFFDVNPPFMERIRGVETIRFFFKGPELSLNEYERHAVFAFFDPETSEIGTKEITLSIPDFKENQEGIILNSITGNMTQDIKIREKGFSISKEDGSLEFETIKFYPIMNNQISKRNNIYLFMQVYIPRARKNITPEFHVTGEKRIYPINGELIANSWNNKLKVWNAIFKLDFKDVTPGDIILKMEIPVSEESDILKKEMKFSLSR